MVGLQVEGTTQGEGLTAVLARERWFTEEVPDTGLSHEGKRETERGSKFQRVNQGAISDSEMEQRRKSSFGG